MTDNLQELARDPTVQSCFDYLRPSLDAAQGLINNAPLSQNERAGLAIMVATYFFTVAGAAQRRAFGATDFVSAREVMELVLDDLKRADRPCAAKD